eukprot:1134097-Pleurochrysis_carterae.AAC.1
MAEASCIAEEDYASLSDPKWRNFRDECNAALLQFEKATEWADLIRYLQRLQRTFNKYSQIPLVPDKVLVAKRLYQCLNPALPSGVHLKTLETYELIFSRIGTARLARDLAFYSEGIFPLYRHASYQARRSVPRVELADRIDLQPRKVSEESARVSMLAAVSRALYRLD